MCFSREDSDQSQRPEKPARAGFSVLVFDIVRKQQKGTQRTDNFSVCLLFFVVVDFVIF